ncbi:GNAT family N-acetyltransferase [Sanyastnella coralliicola]|uniref:GNAT family N-acetyltransferase n=1 Tax=Sanyastnella coralliicola TaxID=3069118 RepID=UPI0027B894D1|nr:GNAT family N-acetyltransferase [Longitalea sp. SCSIO 12813]
MTIRQYNPDSDELDFLQSNGGVFFQKSLARNDGKLMRLVLLDEDDRLFGGLLLEKLTLKGIPCLAAPELHPHCSLFTLPMEGGTYSVQSRRKRVMRALAMFLKGRPERIHSIPFPFSWIDLQPLIWENYKCTVRYTFRLDLSAEGEASSQFNPKLRNSIKKAKNDGMTMREGDMEDLIYCARHTAEAQGYELPEERMRMMGSVLHPLNGKVQLAVKDGEPVAAALFVYDRETVYYLIGGTRRDLKVRGGLDFLLGEMIAESKANGMKTFDFEGTMLESVEPVFRSFGGVMTPYYLASKAPKLLVPLFRLRGRNEF